MTFIILLLTLFSVYCESADTAETYARKVQAHLLIHDKLSACEMGRQGIVLFRDNAQVWESYISSLAAAGFEKEMMLAWNCYVKLYPKAIENRKLIENMAWGIIQKASVSESPMIRIYAALGAFYGSDARGVQVLNRLLKDSNILIRLAAIQLSARLFDASLSDSIELCFYTERSVENRIEIIKAIGTMKIKSLKPQLLAIVANPKSRAEEKAAAIQSIIHLIDHIERPELVSLISSDRAGLRMLACKAIAHFDLLKDVDLISSLINDNFSEIRAAALQLLGMIKPSGVNGEPVVEIAARMSKESNPKVALSAAWLLTIYNPELGQKAFLPWFSHVKQEVRILAASALGKCGKYGFPLIETVFKESSDEYVKLNLAHALIVHRANISEASNTLLRAIIDVSKKLDWEECGIFRGIIPSKNRQSNNPEENPIALSQIVKLELLNTLALVKYPGTQEAVLTFLKQKNWGISGVAAALLLTEGDEAAVDIVKELLSYSEFKVKLQAAIILSLWGQGEDALTVLQESYFVGDREDKERILEAIGRVKLPTSIPFLLDRLNEPSQKLRIITACALLECLYN